MSNISTDITASVNSPKNELKTKCHVKVIDKVPPKQFFKDLKLDDTKDGHQRASFENGTVFIMSILQF